jgi:dCMP deaminase
MNWDEYFFKLIDMIKQKSKDTSTKVGCIIVGNRNEIISTGFNGLPMGVCESIDRCERPKKYLYTEHSERNAIYLAANRGVSLSGTTIYVSAFPCADCMRAIMQSGIKTIVIEDKNFSFDENSEFNTRWKDSFIAAREMMNESNIELKVIDTTKLEVLETK